MCISKSWKLLRSVLTAASAQNIMNEKVHFVTPDSWLPRIEGKGIFLSPSVSVSLSIIYLGVGWRVKSSQASSNLLLFKKVGRGRGGSDFDISHSSIYPNNQQIIYPIFVWIAVQTVVQQFLDCKRGPGYLYSTLKLCLILTKYLGMLKNICLPSIPCINHIW